MPSKEGNPYALPVLTPRWACYELDQIRHVVTEQPTELFADDAVFAATTLLADSLKAKLDHARTLQANGTEPELGSLDVRDRIGGKLAKALAALDEVRPLVDRYGNDHLVGCVKDAHAGLVDAFYGVGGKP